MTYYFHGFLQLHILEIKQLANMAKLKAKEKISQKSVMIWKEYSRHYIYIFLFCSNTLTTL